jgi:hypothetical protein
MRAIRKHKVLNKISDVLQKWEQTKEPGKVSFIELTLATFDDSEDHRVPMVRDECGHTRYPPEIKRWDMYGRERSHWEMKRERTTLFINRHPDQGRNFQRISYIFKNTKV